MARRKKTDPFSARLPHRNSLPFPEADRREAEEKKYSSLSKVARSALKLVKFEMPRLENGRSREGIWNLAKQKAGYPELNPAIGTEKTAAIELCKE